MFTNDVKYKAYIRDIYNTFSPLSWLLKIFSLDCHRRRDKMLSPSHWLITRAGLTVAILAGINLFTLYLKLTYFYRTLEVSVKYTDAVQMVYDLFQYAVDLYFVFKYGSNTFYEYIRQYAYIDDLLGMEYYCTSIKKRLIRALILMIFMWFSSSLSDYIIWAIGFSFVSTSAFAASYVYMLIKILTNLHLTVHVMHIESRLRVIGDLIQEFYCASGSCTKRIEDAVIKENWFYSNKSKKEKSKHPLKKVGLHMARYEVKWLTRCYLLLTEQVNFINRIFGMRILLNSLSLLIDMIRFTNLTVRVMLGTQHTGYGQAFYPAMSTFWRALTCVVVIVSLVRHCEDAYRQRERVVSLVEHLIINRTLDEKTLAAYEELRGLVKSQPINFHMANFMRIDYPLLVSITSVFVTYTIILLQSI